MIRKSSNNNHHNPRKVIIVDWDDTILPSTFVDRWQIENSKDLPLHVSLDLNHVFFCFPPFKKFQKSCVVLHCTTFERIPYE